MRFTKLISLALATAALAVPAAGAHGKPEHGKPNKQRPCRANVAVNLKGTFVAAAADGSSFQMNATRANRHGRPYLKAQQPLTVSVSDKTRYEKSDAAAKLTDLAANDVVLVHAKACLRDLRKAEKAQTPDQLPALTARMVVDQGPAPAAPTSSK